VFYIAKFMATEIFCSTIIPTVGRASLERTVRSVLEQSVNHQDFEVIVVNDLGQPLPDANWMRSDRVRLIETNRRNRCVARNSGAAIARGRYLHFLDDDDWLLPGAFQHLWKVAEGNPAGWIYGGYELVDRQGKRLEICLPDEQGNCAVRFAIGEWLPLQVSLIRSEAFFAVGGFASLDSLLGGDEDVDLSRQISLSYEFAGTSHLVAVIQFGHAGSTTNYAQLRQQSRKSREKMLAFPGASARLLDSARGRSLHVNYWYGRVLWCYLASFYWNMRHRRPFSAVSRLIYSAITLVASGRHTLSRHFWRGATGRQLISGWLSTGKTG
jgi:glycosyltransferase involved in cell wall biosynthesis